MKNKQHAENCMDLYQQRPQVYGQIIASVLLLFSISILSGCYVLKQGMYLFEFNGEARRIESVLRWKDVDANTEIFLQEVLAIKKFAVEELGLSNNRNYTRYVEIDKNYLVDVVTACKSDSFTPYVWKFPIVGEVPYKGFYEKKDAEKLAEEIRARGYDVMVRQVDAFSTLGFFTDPVYSYMAGYSPYSLADMLIHEQTHATIYLKGQSQFNEELATFIGSEGAIAYFQHTYGSGKEEENRSRLDTAAKNRDQFYGLMRGLYADLDRVYTSAFNTEEKLKQKEKIISDFQTDIRDNYDSYFTGEGYRYIGEIELNNAFIYSWNLYTGDLSLYRALYERCGSSLPDFIAAVKPVKEYQGDPKEFLQVLIDAKDAAK